MPLLAIWTHGDPWDDCLGSKAGQYQQRNCLLSKEMTRPATGGLSRICEWPILDNAGLGIGLFRPPSSRVNSFIRPIWSGFGLKSACNSIEINLVGWARPKSGTMP